MSSILPEFPNLAPIDFPIRPSIEHFTADCPEHGDLQFTSLWAWDFGNGGVGTLNGNLVIKLCPPSGLTFYTLYGKQRIAQTAETLLAAARREKFLPALRLVPAATANALLVDGFQVTPDRDHFDYLLSTRALAHMQGVRWGSKRAAANQFGRRFPHSFRELDLSDSGTQSAIESLLSRWRHARSGGSPHAGQNLWVNGHDADEPVLLRIYRNVQRCKLFAFGIEVQREIGAAIIGEVCATGFAIVHFLKAHHKRYPGITEALLRELSHVLLGRGIETINYGSDDGAATLRATKMLLRPVGFVEKYTVCSPVPGN